MKLQRKFHEGRLRINAFCGRSVRDFAQEISKSEILVLLKKYYICIYL
jgi:hypothetical protein